VNFATTKRVLVADDEESYRQAAAMRLRATREYEVDEVSSGEDAIEALKRKQYSLIILDHQMGEVSGLNVMQWMFEQKMQVPVIILTGAGTETVAVEAMKLGAYEYIRKEDFELSRLPLIVSATLERRRFQLERQRYADISHPKNPKFIPPDLLREIGDSFVQAANTSFNLIAEEFSIYQERVRPNLRPSIRSDSDRIMQSLEEQVKLISLLTRTISDLHSIVQGKAIAGPQSQREADPVKGITDRSTKQ
jgi:DNA-binding response OmpR family regulator